MIEEKDPLEVPVAEPLPTSPEEEVDEEQDEEELSLDEEEEPAQVM